MFLVPLVLCLFTVVSSLPDIFAPLLALIPAVNLNTQSTQHMPYALCLSATITFWAAIINLPDRLRPSTHLTVGVFCSFLLLTGAYAQTDNIVQFFVIYELFLLPSAALVWYVSPNKRSLRSTIYFLLWTQAGSMLVLGGVVLLTWSSKTTAFSGLSVSNGLASFLIVTGFCVKVPLFPFYFWLTKTHVEAITSFSIFLSGFLVKLAVVGLWKFTPALTAHVHYFFTAVALLTVILASVAFAYQTDYKKLIAYATVQEMGILVLLFNMTIFQGGEPTAGLLVVHTALSALFFTLADYLFKRYNSRAILLIKGLLVAAPGLYLALVLSTTLFKGLPFTMKFVVEYALLSSAAATNIALALSVAMFVTFFGNLLFAVIQFKCLFLSTKTVLKDLTLKEALYVSTLNSLLLLCVF